MMKFSDKTDKDIILKEFGLSKNAFKRAVGKLLKDGRVKLSNSGNIEIVE